MKVHSLRASFKILIAGDFVAPKKGTSNIVELKPLFSDLMSLFGDHSYIIANLETPLTTSGKPLKKVGPIICSDPEYAKEIASLGINVVSLANNHIMDKGSSGLDDTLDFLYQSKIQYVGAGRNLVEASKPLYLKKNNITLAILAFAENEFSIAESNYAGANPVDPVTNYSQIKMAKENSDVVLVILHGGNEYYSLPSPRMVDLCHYYVDVGADGVICHHTHVPSGYEKFKGAPIYYGLGNFFFQWPTTKEKKWHFGYLVSLLITKEGVKESSIIPYSQNYDKEGVWLLHGREKEEWFAYFEELSNQIVDPAELKKKWKDFCDANKNDYLSMLVSRNKLEIILRSKGFMPLNGNHNFYLRLLNLISCEAHRDVILRVLKNILTN